MSEPEIVLADAEVVLLEASYARVSNRAIILPGYRCAPGQVCRLWLETQHPGQVFGAVMAITGVCLLLRASGLLKLVGLGLVVAGVLRSRMAVHTLMVQLYGEATARPALRTAHVDRARRLLSAIEQARQTTPAG